MKSIRTHYDYIICGGGCAGLSLAMRMCDPFFYKKNILIIDKEQKNENDKTWCFWEEDDTPELYADIISNEWKHIRVADKTRKLQKLLEPLRYKRIQSLNYYDKAKNLIHDAAHIDWVQADIQGIDESGDVVKIQTNKGLYTSDLCFNTIPKKQTDNNEYLLQQHFLGWVVKFNDAILDPNVVELMDFRIPQEPKEVRFVYVLPFNSQEAMIEATIFSEEVFSDKWEYEEILKAYIQSNYAEADFEVIEEEYGVIPMSTESYNNAEQRIIEMGNRSGRIKPSSGYAFKRIQEETALIVEQLKNGNHLSSKSNRNRFLFYDKILFNVLLNERLEGADIFTTMFQKNDASFVLKFLGEKTNLLEEMLIFSRLPVIPFFRAFISEVIRRFSYKLDATKTKS